jgi:hypothetical protein
MRHLCFLIPVLAGSLTSASALDSIPGVTGLSVSIDVISYASQEFNIGYRGADWTSGQRYELNVFTRMESGRVQPGGGFYLFYEEHEWEGRNFDGTGSGQGPLTTQEHAELDCWGFGLQGGATLNLIEPGKALGFALVPYARGGLGFQDFTATDVVINGARYNLSAGSGRLELAAGADLRLTIRSFELVFGGGVDYWSGADVSIYAGTGGGGIAVGSNGTFTGTDAWLRFGLGLSF